MALTVVRIPSVDEEDLRRSQRERDRLAHERTAHINRIKGLLFTQGIREINVKSKYKTLQPDAPVTGDGRPLPPRLAREITREIARLALLQEQIAAPERERDEAPTPSKATNGKATNGLRAALLPSPICRRYGLLQAAGVDPGGRDGDVRSIS